MRLSDLARGSTVLLGVIVAGYVSTSYVDQRFAEPVKTANAPAPTTSAEPKSSPTPPNNPAPSACVGADGSWKNWPWANVPMLSPKCK